MNESVTIDTPVSIEDAVTRMRDVFSDDIVHGLGQRTRNDYFVRCHELDGMDSLILETCGSLVPDALQILMRARVQLAHELLGSFWNDHVSLDLPVPGVFAEVEALLVEWEKDKDHDPA